MKVLECVKVYFLCYLDDEDVLDNVDYYESLLDDSIDLVFIEVREDLIMFVKCYKLEFELIKLVVEGLGFLYIELNYWIRYGG